MQPPPAYSGDQAPPPSYPTQQGGGKPNNAVYWIYWSVLFGTVLTWIFTVSAAADDAWISWGGVTGWGFQGDCVGSAYGDDEYCSLFTGAKAFQILATLVVSFTLVTVFVAAFMKAPVVGKLGLATAVMLTLHAVFQLIAFALMAALINKYKDEFLFDVTPGPTFGVAVVAWLLGLAGAIVSWALLSRATTEQDGPFGACMSKMGAANAGGAPPAGQPGVPVATV